MPEALAREAHRPPLHRVEGAAVPPVQDQREHAALAEQAHHRAQRGVRVARVERGAVLRRGAGRSPAGLDHGLVEERALQQRVRGDHSNLGSRFSVQAS